MQESFYNNRNLIINNYTFLAKRSLKLKNISTTKEFNFSNYDKRIFTSSKKETNPIILKSQFQFTTV
jgi:hypothetical protein